MAEVNFELLRDRRDELDLSNKDLAGRMQLSYNYVSNILSGRDKPSKRVIRRFERVLGLEKGSAGAIKPPTQGDPSPPPETPNQADRRIAS